MRRKTMWKRIAAWAMTAVMLTGNSSFAALAQEMDEMPLQEIAVEAAVPEIQEIVPEPAEESAAEEPEVLVEQIVEEVQAGEEIPAALGDAAEQEAAEGDGTSEADLPAEDEELFINAEEYAEEILLNEAPAAPESDPADGTEGTLEPEYWFDLPLYGPKENEMLPGQEIWMGNTVHWWIKEEEEDREEDLPITNVEVLAEYTWDENGGDVAAEAGSIVELSGDAQDGWGLRGRDYGYARLRLTYITPDGTEESYGNLGDEEYSIFVYDDIYHLEYEYPNGTGNILVSEKMGIILYLEREHYGEDGQCQRDIVDDVQFEVVWYDESIADVSVAGETLMITGKTVGEMDIVVDALIPIEGTYEAVSWTAVWTEVCESYVNIEPFRTICQGHNERSAAWNRT